MKFSLIQKNIINALNHCSKIAGTSKSALPILNNILIIAEKGTLRISATNLEIAIEIKIRAKIEEKGRITIPAQLFTNYINLIPSNAVINFKTIKQDLIITTTNEKSAIKGIDPDEFPIIPKIEQKEKYIIDAKIFKNALEETIFSISITESRIELSGALFSFNKNSDKEQKLVIVGTDSYRLAEKKILFKQGDSQESKDIIIPVKTLQEVLRVIDDNDKVEIYLSKNQILFTYKDIEIISRIISGEFPDYKTIIPDKFNTKAIISKAPFLRAIKRSSFFVKFGINDISLKFLSKKNEIVISSLNNQVGENQISIPVEIIGKTNEIVFNYRYLIDGLTNIKGDKISIEMVDDSSPGLIKSIDDESYLYLIMPIKNN
ncbi:DNA polymerase III subunit beta [Patescibacteria group bacterium]|nr:DNA polymerase III subunit beta [Patescibacteria group bacterium]